MGVDPTWGRFPLCPEMSRFVPLCPLLSRFFRVLGPKKDKRGQTGTNLSEVNKRGRPSKWPPECLPSKFADFECAFSPIIPWRKDDSQRPLFGGDFLAQILAADSLPGAFVHTQALRCHCWKHRARYENYCCWPLRIRTLPWERRDPLTRVFGPFGPKCPTNCPRERPRKAGCAWELSAPKSQQFLRFAITMPIADPRNLSDFWDKTKQCCIAIWGCDGNSLAICDFELQFLSPKPLLSAGFLAIWLRQRGNR